MDDDAGQGKGTVVFNVYGDGSRKFQSPVMKAGDAPMRIDVALGKAKVLTLVVADAGDGINCDHADWADARIVGAKGTPIVIEPPTEKPYILTPKSGPEPRITGPRIFGVRPGHPFLLRFRQLGTVR